MTRKSKKNLSKKIPVGTTVQTRDNYFVGAKHYSKPGYEKKGNYRRSVVVDTNRNDELALVKHTTSGKGEQITGYKSGKSKARPYIYTRDDDNKPIKLGSKFVRNAKKDNVSKHDVQQIKKLSLKEAPAKLAKSNRRRLRNLKNRKKQ